MFSLNRGVTLTRVNENKIVILGWTISLRTHITLHMSCYLLMHSYRSRLYVLHVSCPSVFLFCFCCCSFFLLNISAYAEYTLMVHKVWHPDIVHKCSWKGYTIWTEQCTSRHQHTVFMYKISFEDEPLQNTGLYSSFSALWGNINAKMPLFFL